MACLLVSHSQPASCHVLYLQSAVGVVLEHKGVAVAKYLLINFYLPGNGLHGGSR